MVKQKYAPTNEFGWAPRCLYFKKVAVKTLDIGEVEHGYPVCTKPTPARDVPDDYYSEEDDLDYKSLMYGLACDFCTDYKNKYLLKHKEITGFQDILAIK